MFPVIPLRLDHQSKSVTWSYSPSHPNPIWSDLHREERTFLKEEEEFSTEWIKHKVWLNSMNSYYKSDLHNCACDLVDLYFIIPFGVQLCSEAEDQSYWNMWVFDNLYQCKNKNEKKEKIKHGDIIINNLKMYFPLWFDSYLLQATCL